MSSSRRNADSEDDLHVFEGAIAVLALIESGRRPIRRVLIDAHKDVADIDAIQAAARGIGLRIDRASAADIARIAGGNTHGGVVALAGPRRFPALAEAEFHAQAGDWYAMLDGIEDPFNFGQAVRALYAAGAAGLVLRQRTWRGGDGVVARASAGATERMPTTIASSIDEAVAQFRSRGFRIAMTARDSRAQSIYNTDLHGPLFLLIGGEKRGLKRALIEQADLVLRIPYSRRFPHSLGSAGSTAVLGFELMRQRLRRSDT